MNNNSVRNLIYHLSHDLKPIKSLPHILTITTLWAIVLLSLGFSSAYFLDAPPKAWHLMQTSSGVSNWFFSTYIGIWTLAHTFQSQIPGHKFNRNIFTVMLTLWLVINFSNVLTSTHLLQHFGHITPCYFFIITTGIPMLVVSIWFLKRYIFIDRSKTLKLLSLSIIFFITFFMSFIIYEY